MAAYGQVQTVQTKSTSIDLVTQVDIDSDTTIRQILSEACSETDKLITEESYTEGEPLDMSQAWVVDPLDGTTNYAHGFPHFAVSIAWVESGIPKVGVIYDPFKNELFTAIAGEGAMRNGVPCHVSQVHNLDTALLATGFPYHLRLVHSSENNIDLHTDFLRRVHGVRRAGAAALDLAYVACGRLDGFWELHLAPWDVAAGILIIREAGGQVANFAGRSINLCHRHIQIVGANPVLLPAMTAITAAHSVSEII
jgi:myo-inositol-1(or 4)-monophosphatase